MPFDGTRYDTIATTAPAEAGRRTPPGRLRRILARFIQVPGDTVDPATPLRVANLLGDARRLIEQERHWVRGAYHRTPGRYCAVGALRRAGRDASPAAVAEAHAMLLAVARRGGFPTVEQMNDRTCHEFVLSAFDAAIADALK